MAEGEKRRLGEILLSYGMISSKNLARALKVQKEKNKRIGEVVIDLGFVTQDQINWIISKQLDIPYVRIELEQLNLDLIRKFPEYLIKNYRLIPLTETDHTLVVAMADPTDDEAIKRIKNIYNPIELVFASFQNIEEMIESIKKQFPDIW